MSINLLDLVKDQIGGQLAKHASGFLGESESAVGSALGSVLPTLLGGAVQKASTPSGAQGLMDMISGLDTGMLGDIAGVFGGGASNVNNVLNSGGGIVDMLLGNKLGGIIDIISKVSGLKSGSTSSLLKLAAPFLMSMIGKQVAGKGLGFLTDLLGGQKSFISNALPAGMGSLMGFAADNNERSTSYSSSADTEVSSGGNNWLKWLLPLLLLGGLGWWFMGKKGCNKVEETVQSTIDSTSTMIDSTVSNIADAMKVMVDTVTGVVTYDLGALGDVDLAGGTKLMGVAANGFEKTLVNFITSGTIDTIDKTKNWFTLHDVQFKSGKTEYATDKAMAQLKNVAAILKAYPAVSLKLGGYTDVRGDEAANKKLSQARADQVMKDLIKLGVASKQIKEAVGYGEEFATAAEGDQEGMARDRKTAAKVASK
jgi:outer membrane protein OmpA-like peptidoglycan-associated protein